MFNHWPCLRPHAELVILVPFSVPSLTRQLVAYMAYPPGRLAQTILHLIFVLCTGFQSMLESNTKFLLFNFYWPCLPF